MAETVVAPGAAVTPRPGVLVARLPRVQRMSCSSWAGSGLLRVAADGYPKPLECSVPWADLESPDRPTCIRSDILVLSQASKELLQSPHSAHIPELESPGGAAKQKSALAATERGDALAGTAHRHTAEPILGLLVRECLHPCQRIPPAPWAVECRLATTLGESRAPFSSARAVESLAESSPLPAFAAPPRSWLLGKLSWTPPTHAAMRVRLETVRVTASAGDGAAGGPVEDVVMVVVAPNSEGAVEQVSWPPEAANRGEARTWADCAGCLCVEKDCRLPGKPWSEKVVGMCWAALVDHEPICSRNVLAC